MQKLSLKKLSILGLVLLAASAVTAAILPKKAKVMADGKLHNNADNSFTCSFVGGATPDCFISDAVTGTTGEFPDASSNDNATDGGNTTLNDQG